MSKALESWARADLVAEVKRLRAENEALKAQLVIKADSTKAKQLAKTTMFATLMGPNLSILPKNTHLLYANEVHERDDGLIEIPHATAVRETEKALLVRIDGAEYWFPKSIVHDDSECYKVGTEGTLIIPRKFAEDKGLV